MPIPLPNSNIPVYPPHAEAVTPSDSVDFDVPSTIYAGGAGVVAAIPWRPETGATAVNFTVPAGGVVPCLLRRVNSTNTTATLMVRVY